MNPSIFGKFQALAQGKLAGRIDSAGQIDPVTARLVVSVHNNLSPQNQKAFQQLPAKEMVAFTQQALSQNK